MDKYEQAEDRLAELMGVPKWGMWPRLCRSDAAAFALMVEHSPISLNIGPSSVAASGAKGLIEVYADHHDKETAVRYAIVQAVIAKLEVNHPNEGA